MAWHSKVIAATRASHIAMEGLAAGLDKQTGLLGREGERARKKKRPARQRSSFLPVSDGQTGRAQCSIRNNVYIKGGREKFEIATFFDPTRLSLIDISFHLFSCLLKKSYPPLLLPALTELQKEEEKIRVFENTVKDPPQSPPLSPGAPSPYPYFQNDLSPYDLFSSIDDPCYSPFTVFPVSLQV